MFPFSFIFLINLSSFICCFSSLKESSYGFFVLSTVCFYLVDFGSYIYYFFSSTFVYSVVRDFSSSETLDLSFLTFITVIITEEY